MIIGITGTNGAGKGTVVDYLVKEKGFTHYSARNFIVEEVERRGMPVNRDSTNVVGNDLRANFGPGYIIEQLFAQAKEAGGNAVIESLRAVGEAEFLKAQDALLWAVDADRKARYERSVKRGSGTDHVTFEQFCEQEDRELSQKERHKMNIFGVMQMADAVLINDGTPEELYSQVEAALQKGA